MASGHVLNRAAIAALTILALDTGHAATRSQTGSLSLDLVTQAWTGDFDGMVKRRRIRILTPYSKTHYVIDQGRPLGIVVDFGMKVEADINRALKTTSATKVHVVFVPTPRDTLFQWLIDGRGDIIGSNLTVTAERSRQVDFTEPGQINARQIVVTGARSRPLGSLGDLAGAEVAVREGSVEVESVRALNANLERQGRKPIAMKALPQTLEDEDLLEMVNGGLLAATVVDEVIGEFWAKILPNLTLHSHLIVREDAAIAWAVRKNSPKLLEVLNPIVKANRVGTHFGNVTVQNYLKRARFVKRATADPDLTAFRALRRIFQRYARQYDLDDLLMMAQGFQESGLDHRATSARGAVGIMQVMPATGRELDVGDVRQLEPNVHAGVKYVRVIIDRHFANEPIDTFNKTLFAFAAYNCGPSRLRQLRREAAQRGLDPNLWFNNVERLAAEKVGRQPVEYVSSIYKYFVAYKLTVGEMP
jgi:membrane-bound lytic murein transglycosylase MltF